MEPLPEDLYLHLDNIGPDVQRLHRALGQLGYIISDEEQNANHFGKVTEKAVKEFQNNSGLPPDGLVKERTIHEINKALDFTEREYCTIKGGVRYKNGPIAKWLAIKAFEKFQEAETPLGQGDTGANGRYKIKYALNKLQNPDKKNPYLIVRAFRKGKQVNKAEKEDAGADAVIDLVIPGDEPEPTPEPKRFVVAGRVTYEDDKSFVGGTVRAFHEIVDENAILLGEDTADSDGRYTIRYEMPTGIAEINLRVIVFDFDGKPLLPSDLILKAKPMETLDLIVPGLASETFEVVGKVASRVSAGVEGLKVQIVDKAVGGDVQLAEAVTDPNGAYQVTFRAVDLRERGKTRLDLQARVYAGEELLASSDVRYNASNRESMNILLEESATSSLRSEHETLIGALSTHFKGKLADLKETDERQDVTYLANKSGWDARAVALASLADQFSAQTVVERAGEGIESASEIEPAFFYALFRAGLPSDKTALYRTDPKTAESIWEQSIKQGVIPASMKERIPRAVERFKNLAAQQALDNPALVGVSSLKEMLSISFGDIGSDKLQEKQEQFADLYIKHQGDLPEFWNAVREKFGEADEKRLKLDGKLAYLTLNNAPLIRKLHTAEEEKRLADPLNLVEKRYYRAEEWQKIIGSDPIPQEIPGENDAEKRARYAELMAAKLRLSYPTAVVGQMVKRGETTLANQETNGLADDVHNFLIEHQDKFDIGMQPVEQYIAKNKLHDINPKVSNEITRIQRALQITPSDDSMNALLKSGVDSAYAVTRYDQDEFVRIFESEVGGEANARLIHAKSQQVHNTILNLAVSYLTAMSAPGLGANRSALILDPSPKNPGPNREAANAIDITPNPTHNVRDPNPTDKATDATEDIIAYPTLEGLFGEMDYCTCEHCRSFLSPAAYLVNLLKFIDLSYKKNFTSENPLYVLLKRRPDIEHLPLTCENTNMPLPYIDLVNETLEYYVTHGHSLENYIGHTTDDSATPEELLANPQFVSSKAYEILSGKPDQAGTPPPLLPPTPPLPFHQPLENLRHYFDRFEAPLPEVMEALLENDELERPDPADPKRPVEYGWRDILMEELRLSRAEYELLTDSTLTLQQLCGYPSTTSIADMLGGYLFSVGQNFVIELDRGEVSQSLRDQFEGHGTTLTPPIHVDTKKSGISWIIVDANTKYCIWNKKNTLNVHLIGLSNAKAFTRRVGITYEEIIDILKTRFVNPNSMLIPKLERLGVSFAAIKMLNGSPLTGQSWLNQLPKPLPDALRYGDDIEAWVKNGVNFANIMGLITLADQDGKDNVCSFENLEFRYSDPDKSTQNISTFDFIRLIRFIRLWKKLGWTIEQTDRAIMALYPPDQTPDHPNDAVKLQRLEQGFLTLLPRLGVVKRVMDALNLKPKEYLLPLLACFAPIDTHGDHSLYRQMFLSPALLEQDKAFADDGYGNFLQRVDVTYSHSQPNLEAPILDAAQDKIAYDHQRKRLLYFGVLDIETRDALKDVSGVSQEFQSAVDALYVAQRLVAHAETLRSAFSLTAEELSQVISALSFDDDTPLTLDNISAIFRRGWLARKLKLSVREFLLLIQFTDIDPFAAPDPVDPPILRFVELVNRLRAVSLKPTQALYLIWNQDISGKSTPSEDEILSFARTLRYDFAAIESEFTIVDDPNGQIAREKMALIYGNDATDLFFGLLGDTFITKVPYSHIRPNLETKVPYTHGQLKYLTKISYSHPQATLEQAILDAAFGLIAYDDSIKHLSFDGILTEQIRDAIKAVAGVTDEFKAAVDSLYQENQKIIQAELEQPIVNAAQNRIAYDKTLKQLSYNGTMTTSILNALKSVTGVTDEFKAAVDSLYRENQKVIKANLEQSIVDAGQDRIAYDDFCKLLIFTGLLTETTTADLKIAAEETLPTTQADTFKKAIDELYLENQKIIGSFFIRYPELRSLYDAYYFFGYLSNSVEYEHFQATLEKSIQDTAQRHLAYDPNRSLLCCSGILSEAMCDALKNLPGVSEEFKTAIDNLFEENQNAIQDFFADHSTLDDKKDDYLAADNVPEKMRSVLLTSFMLKLKDRRKRQQALQAVSAAAKTDLSFANTLLATEIDDKYVLHAVADSGKPALDDLMGLEKSGLSEELLTSEDLISGTLSVYLEAPENGYYNIHIEAEADEDATVTLILSDKGCELDRKDNIWSNKEKIELHAGTLYFISIKVEEVKDKPVIRWETMGRGREVIPARYLYSEILIDNLHQSYIRFLKAISLAAALKLTANDIAYIASRSDYQIGEQGWLNSLPIKESTDAGTSTKLLEAFSGLLDFAHMKAELSPEDERFLTVLKDPAALTENKDSLLFTLTRWEEASLDSLLIRFGKVKEGKADRSTLKDLEMFCRIYDAYAWAKKLGVPAYVLIKAATNEPDATTVRDFQSALRARFAESDWLNVLKPINDEMRVLQRDALVAYILHQMLSHTDTEHIDTSEKLFEYFLMDVQMEPCMQTSRIRHALSSVQLFIERCLMNLEAEVELSPADFRKLAKQWEWMKRYRVWEANRKVFLYPENWLEPELRDDQSPFFKEMMSELLQSDITEDRAATALLNYLSKLDEVAKLEPCGMYFEEGDPGTEDGITHVVARTAGGNRKYYYRRCEGGSWTPWEQINLEIEDNPVIPVVWKGRLFLFWLRIIKEAPLSLPENPSNDCLTENGDENSLAKLKLTNIKKNAATEAKKNTQVTVKAVLCWSECYNGKWQPTKTSDIDNPAVLGQFDPIGSGAFDRSNYHLSVSSRREALLIQIGGSGKCFHLYNTHSLPVIKSFDLAIYTYTSEGLYVANLYPFVEPIFRKLDVRGKILINQYLQWPLLPVAGVNFVPVNVLTQEVLKGRAGAHTRIIGSYKLGEQTRLFDPFFYEDDSNVFYVTMETISVPIYQSKIYVAEKQKKSFSQASPLVIGEPWFEPPGLREIMEKQLRKFGIDDIGGGDDPRYVKRFVTEDAYINRGLGTLGTVQFGDKAIGPAGCVKKKYTEIIEE